MSNNFPSSFCIFSMSWNSDSDEIFGRDRLRPAPATVFFDADENVRGACRMKAYEELEVQKR
jgi:hypothetical protein